MKVLSKKFLRVVIVLEILVGGCALSFILWSLWNHPLGPSLEMPAQANAQSSAPPGSSQATPALGSGLAAAPAADPTAEPLLAQLVHLFKKPQLTSTGPCGGPPVMTLLLVGSDERKDDYLYGLADAIRVVRVDFNTPGVMMLDVPRDLWVEIPGIADHYGIDHGKLNQAYFFGNPGMGYYDGPDQGPGLLARTLELNYGLQVDHYLAVDMKTFVAMIDTIGGIDIHVDKRIDLNEGQDGANPDYVFEPGDHHLDGTLALKLAMNRYPTIYQRARNQDIVLKALKAKLLSPGMIPLLPGLVSQFTNAVQTDLSPNELSQLLCLGEHIPAGGLQIVAFPDTLFTGGFTYDPYRKVNTYTLSVDITQMKAYFADFMSGSWPK